MSTRSEIVLPATLADLAEVAGSASPVRWVLLRRQLEGGPSAAVRDATGRAVAVGGVFRETPDAGELWLAAGCEAARHIFALARACRLTVAAAPYRRIGTITTTKAGARLARLAGLRSFGDLAGGEFWFLNR